MDKDIQNIIKTFNSSRMGVRYKDNDLVLITFSDVFSGALEDMSKPLDEIKELWIYGWDIYKLEGKNLARIRNQLLLFSPEFKPYNSRIIISGADMYEHNAFLFISCSPKAFYLPNTKITTYERHNKIIDVDPNDIY